MGLLLLSSGASPKPFPSSVGGPLQTFGIGNDHRVPQQRPEEQLGAAASGGGTASALSTVVTVVSDGEEDNTSPHAQGHDEETSVISLTATNGYPDVVWSPWAHVAEPHRASVLRAESEVGNPDEDVFLWTLPSENGASFEGRYKEYRTRPHVRASTFGRGGF